MPGEMPQAEVTESWRPKHDCQLCRLGSELIAALPNDIRGREATDLEKATGRLQSNWVKPHRSNVVQGDGPVPCKVMLVGEAPGFHEDRDGLGFRPQAPAGRILAAALDEVGLWRWGRNYSPSQVDKIPWVYVTNALKCRPVDNKIDKFLDCLEFCRTTFLEKEIEAVNPRVVVFLGKTAAQPAFGKETSLVVRHDVGRLLIHAPHPSYIARGAVEAKVLLIEALKIAKEVGYGG